MVDSVKGVTEYFKANSVVRIRKADCSEEEKERLIADAEQAEIKHGRIKPRPQKPAANTAE